MRWHCGQKAARPPTRRDGGRVAVATPRRRGDAASPPAVTRDPGPKRVTALEPGGTGPPPAARPSGQAARRCRRRSGHRRRRVAACGLPPACHHQTPMVPMMGGLGGDTRARAVARSVLKRRFVAQRLGPWGSGHSHPAQRRALARSTPPPSPPIGPNRPNAATAATSRQDHVVLASQPWQPRADRTSELIHSDSTAPSATPQ